MSAGSLGRSAAVMAVGTVLSRVTGMGRLAAATYAVGVNETRLADTYNLANTMPNVVYELVLGGVLSSVFIPVVVEELRNKPREEAWEAVSTVVATALTVLLAIAAFAVIAAPWLMRLFLRGGNAVQQQELAAFFLRVFAPQILLYGYAAIAAGLLNVHDRFAVPMFVPILNNLVVIATFLGFAALVDGVPSVEEVNGNLTQKLLLACGTTAGVAVMALANWPSVRTERKLGRLST